MQTLLTQSGDVTTNTAESLGSGLAAETARHLLSHLRHAQVPLRLVVIKGHPKVMHEAQHILLMVTQPHQQVVGFALLYLPLMWLLRWGVRRVALQALRHQFAVASLKLQQPPLRQTVLPGLYARLHCRLDLYKQALHLSGPLLTLLPSFFQCRQLPQMMGIAQG